jgi:hypothetical protein
MSSATYAARDINKAFEAVEREIRDARSLRRFFTDYGIVILLLVFYLPLWTSAHTSEVLPALVVLLSLHTVAETRAQQRQKLLLDALREMQQAIYRAAEPDA